MERIADGLSMDGVPLRIKALRKAHALSQAELATLVGKTRATVVRWEAEGPGENCALVVLALTQLSQRLAARKKGEESPEVPGNSQ